ncbi:hypothetical protein YC2023_033635 [Brassica napus]
MMRICEFTDLQSVGNRLFWVGKRGTHLVQCALDRTMVNNRWFELFHASQTEFLVIGESDHRPLVTFISADREEPTRRFRFDGRMINKEGFTESVRRGWRGTGQSQLMQIPLVQRLNRCKQHISRWKRHNQNNAEEIIGTLRAMLDKAVTSIAISQERKTELKDELNQAYIDEDIYWKQKSRVNWLRSKDCNTWHVHVVTKGKIIKKTINSIQDGQGVIHRGYKEISKVDVNYFQDLYASKGTDPTIYVKVFQTFHQRVIPEMNKDVTRMVTK